MTIKIYIPTFRRVGSQITFNSLPDKYKEKVILVVQRHERPQHNLDVDYLIVDDGIGIAETRKQILGDDTGQFFNGEWNFRGYHPVGCMEPS